MIWGLIAVIVALVAIVSIFDIVRRHLGAGKTTAWILLVVLLPLIGSIAYWAMRAPTASEVDRAEAAEREAHEGRPRPQSTRFSR